MAPHRLSARLAVLLGALLTLAAGSRDPADDVVGHPRAREVARMGSAEDALANAVIALLDPATMNDAEIGGAAGPGRRCVFRYTSTGRPVLGMSLPPGGGAAGGIVKLNGHLVSLSAAPGGDAGADAAMLRLVAGPVRITVAPGPADGAEDGEGTPSREADMVFEVAEKLKVGYRGYLACGPGR